jgi:thymidylate synthase (FAD)
MFLVKPSFQILTPIGMLLLRSIENAARTCYKSNDLVGDDEKTKTFVKSLIARGHHAPLEFSSINVSFITNRGVTHELVRHRLASYCQESTRYCNYGKEKFGGQITIVRPSWCNLEPGEYGEPIDADTKEEIWTGAMVTAEMNYLKLLKAGLRPEEARGVLPNDLKTEINVSANIREWRHILSIRTTKAAHPDIRFLMIELLEKLKEEVPVLFDDIQP